MSTHSPSRHHITLVLIVNAFFILLAACGRQPSQDLLNQMSARLEQLEQKVAQFEAKDVELTELVNEGKAGTLKLEGALAALTQQVEKISSRPSAPAGQKSSQPSASTSMRKKQHTVARGETLYSLAKRYGLSVDELRRINNLTPDQPIQAGQSLTVSPDAH